MLLNRTGSVLNLAYLSVLEYENRYISSTYVDGKIVQFFTSKYEISVSFGTINSSKHSIKNNKDKIENRK